MFRLSVKSGRSIIRLPCGTKFLRVLMFAIFPAIRKISSGKKKKKKNYIIKIIILIILKKIFINTANISPAKIYSRVNILDLKFATQKYSINKEVVSVRFCNRMTKKSNLFCSFNTGYAKRSVFFLNMYFHCTYLIKTDENIINDLSGTFFLSFAKKSVLSKKNQFVLNAKISS